MKFFRSFFVLILFTSTVFGQEKKETLKFILPETYSWKTETDKQDSTVHTIVMIPENEDVKKDGLRVILKKTDGELFVPMEIAMNSTVNKARQKSPKLAMKLIERDKDEKNHWIIFKIESTTPHNDKGVESRLYHIIQGDKALYTSYVVISGKSFPDDLAAQWQAVFKKSVLEYDAAADPFRL